MSFPEYDRNYAMQEFLLHGEYQLLDKLSNVQTIFDVGCNIGEWSRMARALHPDANIHMFEVVPQTFKKMLSNKVLDNNMQPNNFGLSSTMGTIPMKIRADNDRVSTSVLSLRHDNSFIADGLVVPGDTYCRVQNIQYIDYLKIDTEGHEHSVLEGFTDMLKQEKIACIQFEYGYISILTKKLLIDFYQLLTPYDFVLGKITPDGVKFKEYHLLDEDFKGPDYFAVHKSRQDIIDAVK